MRLCNYAENGMITSNIHELLGAEGPLLVGEEVRKEVGKVGS